MNAYLPACSALRSITWTPLLPFLPPSLPYDTFWRQIAAACGEIQLGPESAPFTRVECRCVVAWLQSMCCCCRCRFVHAICHSLASSLSALLLGRPAACSPCCAHTSPTAQHTHARARAPSTAMCLTANHQPQGHKLRHKAAAHRHRVLPQLGIGWLGVGLVHGGWWRQQVQRVQQKSAACERWLVCKHMRGARLCPPGGPGQPAAALK